MIMGMVVCDSFNLERIVYGLGDRPSIEKENLLGVVAHCIGHLKLLETCGLGCTALRVWLA